MAPNDDKLRQYTVSHYASATVAAGGYARLETWLKEKHNVDLPTVYTCDVAQVQLTPAHYAALNAGDDEHVELNALCSAIFDDEAPDWLEDGESLGDFEMEIRVGMDPLSVRVVMTS